jgi:hypothetical protein
MKKHFIAIGAIVLATTVAMMMPVAGRAHHSFAAEYDGSKVLELVGVINKVDQQNPHGFFYMNVTGANGRVTNWALETPGPNQLIRTGFTERYKEMIDNKEIVTVKGYAARDGAKRAFAESITRADKRTVIRISEGGVTTNVGRAPRGDAITVDGVPVPNTAQPDVFGGGRGGGGGAGGGQGRGAGAPGGAGPATAPQRGTPQ